MCSGLHVGVSGLRIAIQIAVCRFAPMPTREFGLPWTTPGDAAIEGVSADPRVLAHGTRT